MNRAVVLHTVDDGEDAVAKRIHLDHRLFSTHSSVDVYLKEKHGLDCRCLTEFMSLTELSDQKHRAGLTACEVVAILDERLAPILNERFGLKINYFEPLYAYYGCYHVSGYLALAESVRRVVEEYRLDKISFYDLNFTALVAADTNMRAFIDKVFPDLDADVITNTRSSVVGTAQRHSIVLTVLRKHPSVLAKKAKEIMGRIRYTRRFSRFDPNKPTILLYEPLCSLAVLRPDLSAYNILYYQTSAGAPYGFKPRPNVTLEIDIEGAAQGIEFNDPVSAMFARDILADFRKNSPGYVNSLQLLQQITNELPLSVGIWGNPPVEKTKALVFEFLTSQDTSILGAQHGSVYGDAFEPWHFVSDFNRCDYFISYGFTENDFKRLYPHNQARAKIVPLGDAKKRPEARRKKPIDILFPVTNSLSMFDGGAARIPPHLLTARQIILLEYLNNLAGVDVYIKPFAGSNYENCSVLPVLERLNNLKIVDYLSLTDFLSTHTPRTVIIEFPSQPLYDCLNTDAQIILMEDFLHPFESRAREELAKRVYFAKSTQDAIEKIDLSLRGELKIKLDRTFFDHYVNKPDAEANILELIKKLTDSGKVRSTERT